jgi:hypothetical protein
MAQFLTQKEQAEKTKEYILSKNIEISFSKEFFQKLFDENITLRLVFIFSYYEFSISAEKLKRKIFNEWKLEYTSSKERIKVSRKILDTQKNLEDYFMKTLGVTHQARSEKVKEAKMKTFQEKYGVDSYFQTPDFKEKYKKTCQERYGTDYFCQSEDFKEKAKETLMEKYGVNNPRKSEIIIEKGRQTYLEKYGVINISQVHMKNMEDINEKFWRENFIKDGYLLVEKALTYHNISWFALNSYCKLFNITEKGKRNNSKTQNNIYEWLKSKFPNLDIIQNVKSLISKELDIVVPKLKLAIEYNGLMWHSFGNSSYYVFDNIEKDDPAHLLWKTQECEKIGWQLLHVMEHEWINLDIQEKWKEYIENLICGTMFDWDWFSKETETEIAIDRRFSDGKFLNLKLKKILQPRAFWFYYNDLQKIYETEQKDKEKLRKFYDCGVLVFKKEKPKCLVFPGI